MTTSELKNFRVSLKMSQQEVALLLGVTQSAWNFYETGRRSIPEYIQREIEFFLALSNRSQTYFINRIANEGMKADRNDAGGIAPNQ